MDAIPEADRGLAPAAGVMFAPRLRAMAGNFPCRAVALSAVSFRQWWRPSWPAVPRFQQPVSTRSQQSGSKENASSQCRTAEVADLGYRQAAQIGKGTE